MSAGIKTETTVEIDWYSLGAELALLDSDKQATFLDGFAMQIHALGVIDAAHQIQYIADGAYGYAAWLAEELNNAFTEGKKS